MAKLTKTVASVTLVIGSLLFWGMPVYADSTFEGTVTDLNSANRSFTFVSDHMGVFKVDLDRNDPITDMDHSVRHFSDLTDGKHVKITGHYSDHDNMFESVSRVIIQHY